MTVERVDRADKADPDAVLAALADVQRRAVMRVLDQNCGAPMPVGTLADRLAEEHPPADRAAPDVYRGNLQLALHHTHLPKLAACGLVMYEPETGQVQATTGEFGRELLGLVESYTAGD